MESKSGSHNYLALCSQHSSTVSYDVISLRFLGGYKVIGGDFIGDQSNIQLGRAGLKVT